MADTKIGDTVEKQVDDKLKTEEVKKEENKLVFDEKQKDYINQLLEEVKKENQSEIDRRVNKFVDENKDLTKKVEQYETDKMSAKEKVEYETRKLKETIEEEKILLSNERLKFQKSQMLADKKQNSKYSELVIGESIEEFDKNLKELMEIKAKEIEEEVQIRMTGSNPIPKTQGSNNFDVSKNPFSKEGKNVTEQMKLFRNDKNKHDLLKRQAGVT